MTDQATITNHVRNPSRTEEHSREVSSSAHAGTIAVLGIRGLPANYGGLETCAEHVTGLWSDAGYDVLVYCRRQHYTSHPDRLGPIRLKYTTSIPTKSLDTLSHTFFSIVDLLVNERNVKTVHLYNTGNGMFVPLLKLFGKRVYVSGDGLEWKRDKWGGLARLVHKVGERLSIRMADGIAVDNEMVRRFYAEQYGADVDVIPYGAKIPERKPELSATFLQKHGLREKQYFLFVGRLVPEKRADRLIDTYRKLETDLPLVIIGDDVTRTPYRDQIFAQKSDDVRMLGFLYGDEYEQLLVNAYAYVSASSVEGTSPSLLAAMGARVCSLVNGIEENRATASDAALMFDADNFDDLLVKWQALADRPELAAAFAERGYEHVREHYRWEVTASRYLEMFGRNQRHAPPPAGALK